ncbi:hypothetical protein [uncultured Rikenella sp.]|uniref:hypothetical protein n=1 Tax=uncultured Rikenella sp. TaxID=368003 RepID=UPI0025D79909|nr:hypothetical protein [uncultured Rikenella sp.]
MSPAPGYRHRDTGALSSVGNDGYSWSSATTEGGDGLDLNFDSEYLGSGDAHHRVYGFQLRCLSE